MTGPDLLVICPTDGGIGYTNHYGCEGDIVLDPPINECRQNVFKS